MFVKSRDAIITLSVALMFSLIAINNMTDYNTNFALMKTVVGMETITATNVKWRAITNPIGQHAAYISIILWESVTAILGWIGAIGMLKAGRSTPAYATGKKAALIGLAMGFALFMGGFVIIAGEWFYLWASTVSSMHSKALLFSLMLASFMYFLSRSE
ncbi:DUF2165 domain-containing protein [Simkania negevensis]|uniref:DUF2165 domain-containing protein n=1 Tax=Simkania negevensis TaxID=83561 RepID=A0ABS3ATH6_9BACT|nr:DUF2165 domain-containing protein [Simkania negevensis]